MTIAVSTTGCAAANSTMSIAVSAVPAGPRPIRRDS